MVLVSQTDGGSISNVVSPTDSFAGCFAGVLHSAEGERTQFTHQRGSNKVMCHIIHRVREQSTNQGGFIKVCTPYTG